MKWQFEGDEAREWDEEFSRTDYGIFWTKRRAETVRGFTKGGRALEIGAGSGVITRELARDFKDIVATDTSRDMLRIARKKGVNKLVVCSAGELPFRESSFDAVVGIEVLEHCADIERSIRDACRVLKPRGRFVFSNLNPLNPRNLIRFCFLRGVYPDFRRLFSWRLKCMLRRAGFRDVRTKYMVFSPLEKYHKYRSLNNLLESFPIINRLGAVLFVCGKRE